jgi:hypothetical protein
MGVEIPERELSELQMGLVGSSESRNLVLVKGALVEKGNYLS